ncbi:MAG: leucine-rich repeat protein, partial [Clostridia bacterium]|nr:leucine-rich repeat protein [Clostridia bacterium]
EDITQKPKRLAFELSEDKSYYIVKGIGGLSGDIVVPETYKQKPVREIAEKAFANSTYLTSIELPESVNILGERAFYKCRNLLSAEILGEMQVIPIELFS